MKFTCPKPDELVEIPLTDCPRGEKWGQINKGAFQLEQLTTPPFLTLAGMQDEANWQTYRGATDATKITLTPLMSSFVIPKSEGIFVGGDDNTTVDGIAEYQGEGVVRATGMFKNISQATYDALKQYSQLSTNENVDSCLTLYLFNEYNKVGAKKNSDDSYEGIKIYNFRVSSRGTDGKNTHTMVDFSFDLPEGWDCDFVFEDVNFIPRKLA